MRQRQWSVAHLPLIRPIGVASLVFLYLPLITVLVFSFNKSEDATVWSGFSTKWYSTILENTDLIRSAKVSLSIAVPCAIIAALIATGLAIGMGKATGKLQNALRALVNAPLVLPEIVTAVGTLALFSLVGVPLHYSSLLFAHVVMCVPFAFLPIRSRLRDFDQNIFEAARDLGASSVRVMMKITVPLLIPALLSSGLLSFIISMDDFLTSLFVSGPETTTLPIYIFGLLKLGATPEVNVIAALLLIIPTLGLLVGITWTATRRRSNEARNK
ncbi:MAG: ABC transporter permease subunit [Actinobacteria bacterium]|uniref:Spermidine/putrescine transport system permease protein PotC n=1 Tax=freshwater metagenome TaxID=449393 RepID=A0A6J7VU51_9ZZZZ|nr:ABC transporter permease subunit [Actinomycetota bacterium]